MKGYRTSKLEEMLTQSLKEGNDERAKEIEKRIMQKEKKTEEETKKLIRNNNDKRVSEIEKWMAQKGVKK